MAVQLINDKMLIAKSDRTKRSPLVQKQEIKNETAVLSNSVVYEQPSHLNIYGDPNPVKAVEVDYDRSFNVPKVETTHLKSDVVSTKVNNKVDKLRALRNGS